MKKKILAILAGIIAAGIAFMALFRRNETSASVSKNAEDAKTKTEENIEKTPAPELVDGDPHASELHSRADAIKYDAQERIRKVLNSKE